MSEQQPSIFYKGGAELSMDELFKRIKLMGVNPPRSRKESIKLYDDLITRENNRNRIQELLIKDLNEREGLKRVISQQNDNLFRNMNSNQNANKKINIGLNNRPNNLPLPQNQFNINSNNRHSMSNTNNYKFMNNSGSPNKDLSKSKRISTDINPNRNINFSNAMNSNQNFNYQEGSYVSQPPYNMYYANSNNSKESGYQNNNNNSNSNKNFSNYSNKINDELNIYRKTNANIINSNKTTTQFQIDENKDLFSNNQKNINRFNQGSIQQQNTDIANSFFPKNSNSEQYRKNSANNNVQNNIINSNTLPINQNYNNLRNSKSLQPGPINVNPMVQNDNQQLQNNQLANKNSIPMRQSQNSLNSKRQSQIQMPPIKESNIISTSNQNNEINTGNQDLEGNNQNNTISSLSSSGYDPVKGKNFRNEHYGNRENNKEMEEEEKYNTKENLAIIRRGPTTINVFSILLLLFIIIFALLIFEGKIDLSGIFKSLKTINKLAVLIIIGMFVFLVIQKKVNKNKIKNIFMEIKNDLKQNAEAKGNGVESGIYEDKIIQKYSKKYKINIDKFRNVYLPILEEMRSQDKDINKMGLIVDGKENPIWYYDKNEK